MSSLEVSDSDEWLKVHYETCEECHRAFACLGPVMEMKTCADHFRMAYVR